MPDMVGVFINTLIVISFRRVLQWRHQQLVQTAQMLPAGTQLAHLLSPELELLQHDGQYPHLTFYVSSLMICRNLGICMPSILFPAIKHPYPTQQQLCLLSSGSVDRQDQAYCVRHVIRKLVYRRISATFDCVLCAALGRLLNGKVKAPFSDCYRKQIWQLPLRIR